MTLLREALNIGAFPSTQVVRQAFDLVENDLLPPSDLPPDARDEFQDTIDEIRDAIKTTEGCKRFRDLLFDLGLFGSARSRRVKAVAAQLQIPIEDITDCLRKTLDELQQEEDAEIDLELPTPEEPPLADDEDCPVDLISWLCLPPERIPDDDDCPQPEPLPGAEDLRTFNPFPGVPDPDDALQLCRFAENRIQLAKSTGEILSTSTLTGFLRMFHALAFRPNPPPAILYKRCTQTALETLTDYWASDLVPPPTEAEQRTIEQINDELDDYDDDASRGLEGDALDIFSFVRAADDLGLTESEAAPWLALIDDAHARAIALGDEGQAQQLEEFALEIERILKTSSPDPNRPTPPDLYRYILPTEQRRQEYEQVTTTYANYLIDKKARGITLDEHEQGLLDILDATRRIR